MSTTYTGPVRGHGHDLDGERFGPINSDEEWTAQGWAEEPLTPEQVESMWPAGPGERDEHGEVVELVTPHMIVHGLLTAMEFKIEQYRHGKRPDADGFALLGQQIALAMRNESDGL